jgi:hypothetical protein
MFKYQYKMKPGKLNNERALKYTVIMAVGMEAVNKDLKIADIYGRRLTANRAANHILSSTVSCLKLEH